MDFKKAQMAVVLIVTDIIIIIVKNSFYNKPLQYSNFMTGTMAVVSDSGKLFQGCRFDPYIQTYDK